MTYLDNSFVNDLLRRLDPALKYTGHEMRNDVIRMFVESTCEEVECSPPDYVKSSF